MRRKRSSWWAPMLAGVLVCALVSLACANDDPNISVGIATETAQAAATKTAQAPTATPVPGQKLTGDGHQCDQATDAGPGYVQFGDLRVTNVLYALSYPFYNLPNATAGKPYKLPADETTLKWTNPILDEPGTGYVVVVCNTSQTASHVVDAVSVTIEHLDAYTDIDNMWQPCDGYYQRPSDVVEAGCGGVFFADEFVKANFHTDDKAGATTTATQLDTGNPTGNGPKSPALPVSLAPGQQLVIDVEIGRPSADGWYTFGFSLTYDSGQPRHISSTDPVLLALSTVKWDGATCASVSAMKSQIPTSDTTNRYVCPTNGG